MFRVIIAGGRDFIKYELLKSKMDNILKNVEDEITIVSGGALGADYLGERYAEERGYKLVVFEAKWDDLEGVDEKFIKVNKIGKKYNVRAGHDRNVKMAENADALVAFWNQVSSGTKDMISIANSKNLKVRVINY